MPSRHMVDSDGLEIFSDGRPPTPLPTRRDTELTNLQRIDIPSLFFSRGDLLPSFDPFTDLSVSRKYFCRWEKNSSTGERASARPSDSASETYKQTSGLSLFFHGIAAGEDMSTLIHILTQTLQRAGQTVNWPTSPLLDRACTEKKENADANPAKFLDSAPPNEDTVAPQSKSPFFNASLSVSSASPMSALISQREWIKQASRAAALFSVESPAASDAVSLLYYSSCHTERLRLKGAMKGAGNGRTASDLFFFRPLNKVLRPLLSDRVAVALARQLFRDSHPSAKHGRLEEVERVLGQIDPTPAVCAVLIDLYSRTGRWEGALRSLRGIPQSLWTEFDVTGVIRSFYRAARRNELPSSSTTLLEGLHSSLSGRAEGEEEREGKEAGPETDFFTYPLLLMKQAMEGKVSWSTPSAINDALGLLSLRPHLWRQACALLDATVLSPHCAGEPPVCERGEDGRAEALHCESDGSVEEAEEVEGTSLNHALVRESSLRHMRPNPVTVYQTCQALSQAPEVAFSYATALLDRFEIPLTRDFGATEQYLCCCAHAGRWQEALRVMKEHQLQLEKERNRHHAMGRRGMAREASSAGGNTADRTRSSGDKSSNFHERFAHYRPDVYLALVKLFGESRCSDGVNSLVQQRSLSKFYNPQTLSRAFNALIQSSKTIDEAMRHYDELKRVSRRRSGKGAPAKANTISAASAEPQQQPVRSEAFGASTNHEMFEMLENESLHQLTILNAMEGRWQEAVTIFQHLLHDPRRKLYVPTTEVHDCIQYALAQAPAPGASWQLSVALFYELCEERQLPTSPLAFQSAVRKCFSQDAGEVAQKLFKFMIRKGVRR
ncbi:unnamed protein product [Phytomonas sp. EM1]|nr:unnamed protein product [Phytomonas sp. EM1]|eukprot:CCW60405.1 unnamed protein product [Phytomonas sp. isolate EM1]